MTNGCGEIKNISDVHAAATARQGECRSCTRNISNVTERPELTRARCRVRAHAKDEMGPARLSLALQILGLLDD